MARKGSFLHEGEYMLYVLAIIEDASGRILITRRALDKRWAAGWWEVTGGGVMAGETSAAAVVREVREDYHFHLHFSPDDVRLQRREAIGCQLATREQIDALAADGVFLHYERLHQALAAEAEGAPAPAPLAAPPAAGA